MRRSRFCSSCRVCIRRLRHICFLPYCSSLADYGFRRNRRFRFERRSVAEVSDSVAVRVELSGIRFSGTIVLHVGDLVTVGIFGYREILRSRRSGGFGRFRLRNYRRRYGRFRSWWRSDDWRRSSRFRSKRLRANAYGRLRSALCLDGKPYSGSRDVSGSRYAAASRFVTVAHFHPFANFFRPFVTKRVDALGYLQSRFGI